MNTYMGYECDISSYFKKIEKTNNLLFICIKCFISNLKTQLFF